MRSIGCVFVKQDGVALNVRAMETQSMLRVPIEKLEPGMKLIKPLTRGNMVILGEGTVLTETWISRIAEMGVDHVFIEGRSEQPVSREEALMRLNLRFRNVEDRPHMKQIKEITRAHIEGLYG
jgi:hypothetical protein